MARRFTGCPIKPVDVRLQDGWLALERAFQAAESFFDSFDKVRKGRSAVGAPTDHEQDLLRAALTFAAAGLDAMAKQLVRDVLAGVLQSNEEARRQFADFIEGRLRRDPSASSKFLAATLVASSPAAHLQRDLIAELTGSSLQSVDQLLRVAAFFAIPAAEITKDIPKLRDAFTARNEIAHEMDIIFTARNRSRRSRTLREIQNHTACVLATACALFSAVQRKMAPV